MPDWQDARIECSGLCISAQCEQDALYLVSGSPDSIEQVTGFRPDAPEGESLRIAPDKFLLVLPRGRMLSQGWHGAGVAVSAMSDAYVRIDVTGPLARAIMLAGSESLALQAGKPLTAAALGFAGITVLVKLLPLGCSLFVERPQASYLWQWLEAAAQQISDDRFREAQFS
jgi:sarcosine oxidase gamma subunit